MSEHTNRPGHVTAPADLRQMFRWHRDRAREENPQPDARTAWSVEEAIPFPLLDAMFSESAVAARVEARRRYRAQLVAAGRTMGSLSGREWEALSEADVWPEGVPSASRVGEGAAPLPSESVDEPGLVGGAGDGPSEVVFPRPADTGGVGACRYGAGGVGEVSVRAADESVCPGHTGHLLLPQESQPSTGLSTLLTGGVDK